MKCFHSKVQSDEWTQCPKCGKIVRCNSRNQKICHVLFLLLLLFAADPLGTWALRILHLEAHNPRNLTHGILGCALVLPVWLLAWHFFPDYDEKPSTDEITHPADSAQQGEQQP